MVKNLEVGGILTRGVICDFIRHEGMEQQGQDFQQVGQPTTQRQGVAFPTPPSPKKRSFKFLKWVFALVGVVLIVGGGGWFLYSNYLGSEAEPSPTPSVSGLSSFATLEPEATSAPTSTPKAVDKSELKVEVLNGTGKAGEASYLKTKLEAEGFESVTAANAEDQNETRTTVTYGSNVSEAVMSDVTELLEGIYESVRVRKGSAGEADIRVVTGSRKGAAAETSATATPTSKASATATPLSSPSPTPEGE